ncbi:hypothetical protein GN958_ATG03101 [Phytophthora infestans]|uniref:Uncharacterized protein n=1 Tax=Phytophthora infestans TaxID=4787 RepID=A0A8S9V2Q2_PHYIN|nr:hypothetical protein GN958_ATG03101 [Phytophthora infestans]
MENYGSNGPMNFGERLKPIALVLRPHEPCRKFEESFQYWLKRREGSLSMLKEDPNEERRYRQASAFLRATTAIHKRWERSDEPQSLPCPRTRSRSRSRGRAKRRSVSRETILNSRDTKRTRIDSSIDQDSLPSVSDSGRPVGGKSSRAESVSRDRNQVSGMNLDLEQLKDQMEHRFTELERELQGFRCKVRVEGHVSVQRSSPTTPTDDDQVAEPPAQDEVLKKAAKANADPAKKRLTRDYTRVSTQIAINEAAMKAWLAYVNNFGGGDEAEIEAHLTQIKELATCIDSEKQRRDTALAAVIAQEW